MPTPRRVGESRPLRRLRARARAVPAPLAALLAAVLVVGWAWALLVPPAQAPDEPVHFAWVENLVERGERPLSGGRDRGRDVFSTEQKLAREAANYEAPTRQPSVRPEWRAAAWERWRRQEGALPARSRRDGGVENAAAGNPPLYYGWVSLAYRATGSGGLFTRWYAMRMWSVLLLAVAVLATWLMAGQLTGRDRLAQLGAAAFVGLQPGASAISAAVNPDAGMIAAWALVLWLGVRALRGPPRLSSVLAVLAATLAALLVKAPSFGLLPGVALVLLVVARRAAAGRRPSPRAIAVLAVLGALGVGAVALAVAGGAADRLTAVGTSGGRTGVRGFLSYLWQAYLPNLPFQTQVQNLPAFWGYDVWIRSGWGNFGWSELLLPRGAYAAIGLVVGAIFAGAAVAVVRRRFGLDWPTWAFFAAVAAALVIGLHWGEYNQFVDIHVSLLQGRYLLPLLPLGGMAVVAALSNLDRARRALTTAVLLVLLFAVQLFSLGIVVGRFYA